MVRSRLPWSPLRFSLDALLVGVALAGFGGLFAFHAGRLGPTTFEETRNHGGFFPDGWSLP